MDIATPRPVVIDTDPGIDDAVAILFALGWPGFDVRAVATLAGNIGLATTTANASRLLALAGRADIPVFAGAAAPLSRPGRAAADVHGEDGIGGVKLPAPLRPPEAGDAVARLAELLAAAPAGSVDVLALGPLTNLARLLQEHPQAARRIGRVIAMGGALRERGNVGLRAEFNLAFDPEAAAVVFGAGLDLTLIPLDVTRRVRADRGFTAALAAAGTPAATTAAALIEAYFQATDGGAGVSRPLHDPCVMLLAALPAAFAIETVRLRVDLGPWPDGGALTEAADGDAVAVATRVDPAAALALLAEGLGRR